MKITSLLISFAVLSTGCASNPNTYSSSGAPSTDLATVYCEDAKWYDAKITPKIVGVYSEGGEEVIGTSFWGKAFHREVKLEPGKYLFTVKCGNGSVYAYPRAVAELMPSRRYILNCIATTKTGFLGLSSWDKVRAEIREFGK